MRGSEEVYIGRGVPSDCCYIRFEQDVPHRDSGCVGPHRNVREVSGRGHSPSFQGPDLCSNIE